MMAVGGPGQLCGQTTYAYTGGSQTYTVPTGVTSIRIKAWGGGGGASANTGTFGSGGGAGFVQADVAVTSGQRITVVVGQGGAGWSSTEGWAGGAYPNGGSAQNYGGGGAGRTEVSGTGLDLVAAGGGGGGYYYNGTPGQGGYGGATTGGAGGSSPKNAGGQGGTQSAGGAGGYGDASTGSAGALRSGGNANAANCPGGAGGDGFYGGGGGGGGVGGINGAGDSGGGGGGGSCYAAGSSTSNIVTNSGSGSTPGNSSDSARLTSGCSILGNYGAGAGATTATYRGGNGEVSISTLAMIPVITSALSEPENQGQTVSYQITAQGNPTSYGATGLPNGLSINTSTGQITGSVTQGGTVNTTISATNSVGTGNATLTWTITAVQIVDSALVSPSVIILSQYVTLTRSGTANFGISYTENFIWPPASQPSINLGNMQLGSMNYTPVSGTGVYSYQFRIVDIYNNYVDQYINFTVNTASVTAPTTVQATVTGSTFVTLSWNGANAQLGIASYNIYRNGGLVGNTTGTAFTDSTASPSTSYIYTVVTVDTQSNDSPASSPLAVTTALDFEVFTPIP